MANSEGFGLISMGLVGAATGFFVGAITEARINAEPRIAQVQLHNAEVKQQLTPMYGDVGRLVLNDETDTFEFHISPEGEEPQTCEGEYEVTDDNAKIVGQIACTTTTEVEVDGN
jgi:hypothetical protein